MAKQQVLAMSFSFCDLKIKPYLCPKSLFSGHRTPISSYDPSDVLNKNS